MVTTRLSKALPNIRWSQEHQQSTTQDDAVDIFGESSDALVVIELDKHRADQLAKKFLSRTAIFSGKKFYYIALCYPGTKSMSKGEAIKYFGYCANIARRLRNGYAGFIIQG